MTGWIYPIGAPPDFEATHVRDSLILWSCENCSLSPRLGIQFGEVEIGISCAQRIVTFQKSGGVDLSMTGAERRASGGWQSAATKAIKKGRISKLTLPFHDTIVLNYYFFSTTPVTVLGEDSETEREPEVE